MEMKKVGFIGLGEMGSSMAKNLLKKGFELTVYDLRKEVVEALKKLGASSSTSCQELAKASDVIISMVRDDPQTEEAIHGKNGVWEGIKKGSIIILMSTIDPLHCQRIAAEGAGKGIGVLDAPVSGMRTGAEAGTLTIMVGGNKPIFEKCRPVFEAMGKNIYYIGKSGMGEVTKLANNLMGCANMAALADAVALGLKAGVDLDSLLSVIKVSTGSNWAVQNFDLVLTLTREYAAHPHGSTLDTMYKDMGLVLKLAREVEQFVPVAALCSQMDIAKYFPGVKR